MSGVSSKSKSLKASSTLTRSYLKSSKSNMKEIVKQCEGNVELQSMILETIREYHADKSKGSEDKQSFADLVANRIQQRKKKKDSSDEDDDESDDEPARKKVKLDDLKEEPPLRRGQMMFREWSHKRCLSCITHMDPEVNCTQLSNCKIEGLREILEHILNIRVHGAKPDRCGTDIVFDLYSSLKKCYDREGALLNNVEFDTDTKNAGLDKQQSAPNHQARGQRC